MSTDTTAVLPAHGWRHVIDGMTRKQLFRWQREVMTGRLHATAEALHYSQLVDTALFLQGEQCSLVGWVVYMQIAMPTFMKLEADS